VSLFETVLPLLVDYGSMLMYHGWGSASVLSKQIKHRLKPKPDQKPIGRGPELRYVLASTPLSTNCRLARIRVALLQHLI
jgi:hypothetical protein